MNIIIREEAEFVPEPKQVTLKEQEYYAYIQEHINFVKESYKELFVENKECLHIESVSDEDLQSAIDEVAIDVAVHDNSKFSDDEFYGYRVWYYPTQEEENKMNTDDVYKNTIEEKYNNCWLHHIKCNNHHSEHWKCNRDGEFIEGKPPLEMELKCIIHMICDWNAMSKKFKTDTLEWYQNQFDKDEKHIHPTTRKIVEEILHELFEK